MAHQSLNEDELIHGLFQYIRLNKTIPDFFADIENNGDKHQPYLKTLSQAILAANFKADIFQHPDCSLYLFYLIKEKQIPFWQGMTINAYLLALAQFTNLQNVKEKDMDTKSLRKVAMQTIVVEGKLTDQGESFLKKIVKAFKKLNIAIDHDELVKFVLTLPASEQTLLQIEMKLFGEQSDIDDILSAVVLNVPCFTYKPNKSANFDVLCSMPSSSLMQYLLTKISPEYIQLKPIMGSVNEQTLYQLHNIDQHPGALYSNQVKSNLKDVDGRRCGPFVAWLHDIAHCFWGSFIKLSDRGFIASDIIPAFETLKKEAAEVKDTSAVKIINEIIDKLNDYNLSNLVYFSNDSTRFYRYLNSCLARGYQIGNASLYTKSSYATNNIGEIAEDRVFFLLAKFHYSLKLMNAPNLDFWERFYQNTIQSTETRRDKNIINALDTLAKNIIFNSEKKENKNAFFNFFSSTPKIDINLDAWDFILNKKNSKMIWNISTKVRHDDLINLITHQQLKFFEPYVPLSQSEFNRLQRMIQQQKEPVNPIVSFFKRVG